MEKFGYKAVTKIVKISAAHAVNYLIDTLTDLFIYLFIITGQAALLMCPGKKEFTKIYKYYSIFTLS